MKTKIYSYLLILFAVVVSIACNKNEGDTTPPTINMASPAEGDEFVIGDDHGIHLDMELSDDEMLATYKVEIHNNFNGHTHTMQKAAGTATDETKPFSFQNTWDISGQKNMHVHHHEIVIPTNSTPGNYHIMVYCIDDAGNESHVAKNIVLVVEGEGGDHDHDHDHEGDHDHE